MINFSNLGSAPFGEKCTEWNADNYFYLAGKECNIYVRQLWRMLEKLGTHKENAPDFFNIVIRSNPNDFGTYFEVAVRYNEDDKTSLNLACYLSSNVPEFWDDEAKKELCQIQLK
jgi:hypothetical protein